MIMITVIIGFLILSLALHEYGHAWMAYKCGDDTAERMGRLTLNPLAHIDPIMTIILPAVLYFTMGFAFGGAKPVPVATNRLRHPARDMMFVALAGPAMNVLLAIVFNLAEKVLIYHLGYESTELLPEVMWQMTVLNLLLATFNMIPIPPLDGSRVLYFFLPPDLRRTYQGFERYGLLIVFGFIMFGGFESILRKAIGVLVGYVEWITGGTW